MTHKERFIFLVRTLIEGVDGAVEEKILEEMDKLWYYHLTPLDKEELTEVNKELSARNRARNI